MKILVVYYSHSGNNEKLALYLKQEFNCKVQKISELKKRNTISILLDFVFSRGTKIADSYINNLAEFEKVVLVSPIWGCKVATPLRAYLEKEKTQIDYYSFISLCNGENGQKEKVSNDLSHILGKKPAVFTELSINKLLPPEKQNQIKHTFNFRISDEEIKYFRNEIEDFISQVESYGDVV